MNDTNQLYCLVHVQSAAAELLSLPVATAAWQDSSDSPIRHITEDGTSCLDTHATVSAS